MGDPRERQTRTRQRFGSAPTPDKMSPMRVIAVLVILATAYVIQRWP